MNPNSQDSQGQDAEVGHFCGVAGMWSPKAINVPERLFYMLFSLQHRGQEGAGISYLDPASGKLTLHKDRGMVAQVLASMRDPNLLSPCGIGHNRYSTAGGSAAYNAQPIQIECNKGSIALAHNGNISNSEILREELSAQGAIFQTTSDTEIILHLISRSRKSAREEIIKEAFGRLEGAFSVVMLWGDSLYAIRDPKGFRPLYAARSGEVSLLASETCALHFSAVDECREVAPGEVVRIDASGWSSFNLTDQGGLDGTLARCVFELIYFARPDSSIFGTSVHQARLRMGAALADVETVRGDVVVPVPDSGNIAAIGYSKRSGLPFDFGLCRNHYTGRSFILPNRDQRELAVRMKLSPVPEVVRGRKIILIDDSLVRGTTSKIIVRLLREAGAAEVHIRLSSPEVRWPCYYGIDIPTREELISNRYQNEAIAEFLGADSVRFLPLGHLDRCVDDPQNYCRACFDGKYPCALRVDGKGC